MVRREEKKRTLVSILYNVQRVRRKKSRRIKTEKSVRRVSCGDVFGETQSGQMDQLSLIYLQIELIYHKWGRDAFQMHNQRTMRGQEKQQACVQTTRAHDSSVK